ncbi:MoaD/ThiS family protein [Aestuariispira insulae]|uniref:ThiS family protein n=1 Tax=Aestuariispira insulae TaxID=1461337 RepID=A0A3D9HHW3_9PROT|nr:MoaD/ThiS family protein [Aestuariispira insulae]RED49034.1 ThiS family protein [Aestuariispira insulae]
MPVHQVTLSGIVAKTAGLTALELEGNNIRQLLKSLEAACPDLGPLIAKGVAVSIDGTLYRDDWFQPIPEGAEVFVIPRLAGG